MIFFYQLGVRLNDNNFPEQVISELRGVTCHMGSQCYLPPDTSEHTPPYPHPDVGAWFSYPWGMEDWVYL